MQPAPPRAPRVRAAFRAEEAARRAMWRGRRSFRSPAPDDRAPSQREVDVRKRESQAFRATEQNSLPLKHARTCRGPRTRVSGRITNNVLPERGGSYTDY